MQLRANCDNNICKVQTHDFKFIVIKNEDLNSLTKKIIVDFDNITYFMERDSTTSIEPIIKLCKNCSMILLTATLEKNLDKEEITLNAQEITRIY